MTTVREVAETLGLSIRTAQPKLDTEVTGGVVCDLLSVVLSGASQGNLWVTVQCHPNIVAVAVVSGLAGVVVTGGLEPERETLLKAEQEAIPILTTEASSFEVAGRLYSLVAR
jgi:predicted transcriptional regulator